MIRAQEPKYFFLALGSKGKSPVKGHGTVSHPAVPPPLGGPGGCASVGREGTVMTWCIVSNQQLRVQGLMS